MEENLENQNLLNLFSKNLSLGEVKAINPLTLAYIGDAVYEIYIRKYLVLEHPLKVNELNKRCIKFVKATAQKNVVNSIEGELTEEEIRIIKRGRNSSPKTVPKHTQLIDYKLATGFEALLGYLYLLGDQKRLEYIIEQAIKITLADSI